jgi:hypothetical protein
VARGVLAAGITINGIRLVPVTPHVSIRDTCDDYQ